MYWNPILHLAQSKIVGARYIIYHPLSLLCLHPLLSTPTHPPSSPLLCLPGVRVSEGQETIFASILVIVVMESTENST